jgi:hypothetical protein
MWERRGGYERVEVRRGEVRKRTDVPLHTGANRLKSGLQTMGTLL